MLPYPWSTCHCQSCELLFKVSTALMRFGNWNLVSLQGFLTGKFIVSSEEALDFLLSTELYQELTLRCDEELELRPMTTAARKRQRLMDHGRSEPGPSSSPAEDPTWTPSMAEYWRVQMTRSSSENSPQCSDTTMVYEPCGTPLPQRDHQGRFPFTYFGDPQALASPPDVQRWRPMRTESRLPRQEDNQSGSTATTGSETSSSTTSSAGYLGTSYLDSSTGIQSESMPVGNSFNGRRGGFTSLQITIPETGIPVWMRHLSQR